MLGVVKCIIIEFSYIWDKEEKKSVYTYQPVCTRLDFLGTNLCTQIEDNVIGRFSGGV